MASGLARADLDALPGALRRHGYIAIGPTVRDGADPYAHELMLGYLIVTD